MYIVSSFSIYDGRLSDPCATMLCDRRCDCGAEIWTPSTQSWRNDASAAVPRTYHSAAALLPDGRVFVGGSGLCGTRCSVNHLDAEMYSPNYLFNADGTPATRPTVTLSASSVGAPRFAPAPDAVGLTQPTKGCFPTQWLCTEPFVRVLRV